MDNHRKPNSNISSAPPKFGHKLKKPLSKSKATNNEPDIKQKKSPFNRDVIRKNLFHGAEIKSPLRRIKVVSAPKSAAPSRSTRSKSALNMSFEECEFLIYERFCENYNNLVKTMGNFEEAKNMFKKIETGRSGQVLNALKNDLNQMKAFNAAIGRDIGDFLKMAESDKENAAWGTTKLARPLQK